MTCNVEDERRPHRSITTSTHLVLCHIISVDFQCRRVQFVQLDVRDDIGELVRASASQVPQRAVEPFEVVVDLEALDVRIELT